MLQQISVTSLRDNLFEVVLAGMNEGQETLVTYNGKKAVTIVPYKDKFDWGWYMKNLDKWCEGLRKYDWSDVLEIRAKSRIRRYKGW